MARSIAQQCNDGRIQLALLRQAIVQLAQFAARGQLSKPQQVASLFEIRLVGQFVNVDAAIGQNAAISVDVADLGSGGNDALKSLGGMSRGHAGHGSLASIRRILRCRTARGERGECNLFFIPETGASFQRAVAIS